uniref:Uncharacterized protein n=1 Tax=Cacopsylla melanoneura TaxID=428564 RepID=A0A8D8LRE5_9HEMI
MDLKLSRLGANGSQVKLPRGKWIPRPSCFRLPWGKWISRPSCTHIFNPLLYIYQILQQQRVMFLRNHQRMTRCCCCCICSYKKIRLSFLLKLKHSLVYQDKKYHLTYGVKFYNVVGVPQRKSIYVERPTTIECGLNLDYFKSFILF